MSRTKIIATVGPASNSAHVMKSLIAAGVDVLRFNLAHADHATHARLIRQARALAKQAGRNLGILMDLPGPKIRVGTLPPDGLRLNARETVELTSSPAKSKGNVLPIIYPTLSRDLKIGQPVFVADGTIQLKVMGVSSRAVTCRVLVGGVVRRGNGVNFPLSALSLPAFTRADRKHLALGLKEKVDFVGISFVGHAEDVRRVKRALPRRGPRPFLIAKIERQEALKNLRDILKVTDGLMVARGDLGVEVPFSQVPHLQRRLVDEARRQGKPVIVATQVLESMIENPRPTRAEATDVANAVREGADALMLSGETAVGQFPVQSVRALQEIIGATERVFIPGADGAITPAGPFVEGACRLAEGMGVKAILVRLWTGGTCARFSMARPTSPIVALGGDPAMRRRFALYWGVETVGENWRRGLGAGARVLVAKGGSKGETGVLEVVKV